MVLWLWKIIYYREIRFNYDRWWERVIFSSSSSDGRDEYVRRSVGGEFGKIMGRDFFVGGVVVFNNWCGKIGGVVVVEVMGWGL